MKRAAHWLRLAQLALAFGATEEEAGREDPAVPHPQPLQDDEAEPKSSESEDKPKKKRKRRAKTVVGARVERVVHEVTVPVAERGCACCDEEMAVIGHVQHETLEFVPAKFILHVERREKLAGPAQHSAHPDPLGPAHRRAPARTGPRPALLSRPGMPRPTRRRTARAASLSSPQGGVHGRLRLVAGQTSSSAQLLAFGTPVRIAGTPLAVRARPPWAAPWAVLGCSTVQEGGDGSTYTPSS